MTGVKTRYVNSTREIENRGGLYQGINNTMAETGPGGPEAVPPERTLGSLTGEMTNLTLGGMHKFCFG